MYVRSVYMPFLEVAASPRLLTRARPDCMARDMELMDGRGMERGETRNVEAERRKKGHHPRRQADVQKEADVARLGAQLFIKGSETEKIWSRTDRGGGPGETAENSKIS